MTNTGNYDSEGLFFDMVNRHRDEVNLNDVLEKQLESNVDVISKAIEKSIRDTEYEINHNRQVEANKKANRKFIGVLLAGLILLGVSVNIAGRTINEHMKINAVQFTTEQSIDGFISYAGSLGSSDSYSKIDNADVITVYILKDKLSPEEFGKFINSQTYVVPDSGEIRNYSNFLHYLSVNDFSNEREFKKAAEEAMLDYYNENQLSNRYTTINVNSSKGVR